MTSPTEPTQPRRREQRGWAWYDWANSAFPTSVVTVFLALYLTGVAVTAAQADTARNGPNPCPGGSSLVRCDVSLLGVTFPAGSLWGYLLAAATAVQVLVLPIVGSVADRTQAKRAMLAVFAFSGAVLTALLALVTGGEWRLGVVLFILAAICYGSSLTVYYSLLPEIADADERDSVSARGWAFGYLGGGVALAVALGVVLGNDALGVSESDAVRICFVLTGLWWAGFTLIPLARLRRRSPGGDRNLGMLTGGFRQLGETLREARYYPLTLGFLGAYLVFADGIVTVQKVSAQYGDQQLGLSREVLIVTVLIVQFVAFPGALLHGRLARRYGTKRTIMGSLVVWIALVGAAFFLQPGHAWQFFALAIGIGLVLGGTLALSRSLFSQLVPPGREGAYFSLYLLSERGTSWLGPLLYAGTAQLTGSFRWAILSVIAFFVIGLVLVSLVPVRRAIRAAGNPEPAVV